MILNLTSLCVMGRVFVEANYENDIENNYGNCNKFIVEPLKKDSMEEIFNFFSNMIKELEKDAKNLLDAYGGINEETDQIEQQINLIKEQIIHIAQ